MMCTKESLYPKGLFPFLVTLVAVALLFSVAPASAASHSVAPRGAEFSSIQDAINHAAAGDTVTVASGIYNETVRITKSLKVTGIDTGGGLPVIEAAMEGNAVEIPASDCTFSGFTVRNAKTLSGIHVTGDRNLITGNVVTGCSEGILLDTADNNTVSNNEISRNVHSGIALESSGRNVIEGNSIIKNSLGLTLDEYSATNVITRNNFDNTINVVSRSITSRYETNLPLQYTYLGVAWNSRMGNYWSDYLGIDANRDGIGDTPYVIRIGVNPNAVLPVNQDSKDTFPLMDPTGYYHMDSNATPVTGPAATPVVTATTQPSALDNMTGIVGAVLPDENTGTGLPGTAVLVILTALFLAVIAGAVIYRRRKTNESGPGGSLPQVPPPPGPGPAPQEETAEPPLPVPSVAPSAATVLPGTATDDGTGPTPPATLHPYFPHELETRYAEVRLVGRGGIAWVYSALRTSDRVRVAVKIPISFDEMTGKSFLNEIKVWEMLRHKNIVEISAVNILPVPFVEMEFVPGCLETVAKPLPVEKAVSIVRSIADALRYAHDRGIIHRDIKPHNILVMDDMTPKITDWGMSKVLAADPRISSIAGFSLSYAAPEQVSPGDYGKRTDVRTDIYQLGVVFYELVTGFVPFAGESIISVGNAILKETPALPSEINPDAIAVDKIIMKCLEKDPALRYQSAVDLLHALDRYPDGAEHEQS